MYYVAILSHSKVHRGLTKVSDIHSDDQPTDRHTNDLTKSALSMSDLKVF